MEGQRIRIHLVPSRRIAGVVAVLHLLAVAVVALAALPGWLAWLLWGALVAGLLVQIRAFRAVCRRAAWLIRTPDAWLLQHAGNPVPVAIESVTMMLGPVVVLRLRCARRRYAYLLTEDALGTLQWRRLRVALRIGSGAAQPGVRIVSSASGARSG